MFRFVQWLKKIVGVFNMNNKIMITPGGLEYTLNHMRHRM